MVLKAKATQKGMLREMLLPTQPQEPVPVPSFQLFFLPIFHKQSLYSFWFILTVFCTNGQINVFLIFPSALHEGYLTTDTSPFAFFHLSLRNL